MLLGSLEPSRLRESKLVMKPQGASAPSGKAPGEKTLKCNDKETRERQLPGVVNESVKAPWMPRFGEHGSLL
jgi:hypothetical protein